MIDAVDGDMNAPDEKTCGEMSCDECNDLRENLQNQLTELRKLAQEYLDAEFSADDDQQQRIADAYLKLVEALK